MTGAGTLPTGIVNPSLSVVAAPIPAHRRAAGIADAVVYGVVPAFYDPPGFAGVAARLDDLADLGVSALWLAPITRTLPGNFGYAVTDYFDLRPECCDRGKLTYWEWG